MTNEQKQGEEVKAKLSKARSRAVKSGDKLVEDVKDKLADSKDAEPAPMINKGSNEDKLLHDVEIELQPLTDFLSSSAEKLKKKLDEMEKA